VEYHIKEAHPQQHVVLEQVGITFWITAWKVPPILGLRRETEQFYNMVTMYFEPVHASPWCHRQPNLLQDTREILYNIKPCLNSKLIIMWYTTLS
jgi:hypothetical protein